MKDDRIDRVFAHLFADMFMYFANRFNMMEDVGYSVMLGWDMGEEHDCAVVVETSQQHATQVSFNDYRVLECLSEAYMKTHVTFEEVAERAAEHEHECGPRRIVIVSGESYVTAELQDGHEMGESGDIVLKEKLVTRGNAAGSEGSVRLMEKFMEYVSAAEKKRQSVG